MLLSNFFLKQAARERDSYIAGSLTAADSSEFNARLLDWSSRGDHKTRLLAMKFHKQWRHPDCPVLKWHKELEEHTGTSFTTIQHWQNQDTHFYHEFLIIHLTDGSACRLERMGQGSRADAIRRTGCTAHDLIQWFSPKDILAKKWSRGSDKLLIQVDFPSAFDLLDVLAICYTIQHKLEKTSVYNLQRFNCYFLCSAVLVILSRRVGSWESLMTQERWTAGVTEILEELRHVSLMPTRKQNSIDCFAIGIFSLIDPDNPDPARFLLNHVGVELAEAFEIVNEAVADTLWYKQLEPTLMDLTDLTDLEIFQKNSSIKEFDREGIFAKLVILLGRIDEVRYPRVGLDLVSVNTVLSRGVITAASSPVQALGDVLMEIHRMQRAESGLPIHLRLASTVLAPILGWIWLAPTSGWFTKQLSDNDDPLAPMICGGLEKISSMCISLYHTARARRADATANRPIKVQISQVLTSMPHRVRSDLTKFFICVFGRENDLIDSFDFSGRIIPPLCSAIDQLAECFHSLLLSHLEPKPGVADNLLALAFLNSYCSEILWLAFHHICISRRVVDMVTHVLAHKSAVLVTCTHQALDLEKKVMVADLQEHISRRIEAHAKRVESVGLADANLVYNDITKAITDIWRLLPSGYGRSRVAGGELAGARRTTGDSTSSMTSHL